MFLSRRKTEMVDPAEALPGRTEPGFALPEKHAVLNAPLVTDDVPDGLEVAEFGLGCFWGAEEIYWQIPGVWSTSVGYAGGVTPNPTYEEVCTGRTGHAEVVRIVFDPKRISYEQILKVFWESHDPTQGMRQGNDIGSQYRSILLTTTPEQQATAEKSRDAYQVQMTRAGYGEIKTSILPLDTYWFAEDYHQQYLFKNPAGYCPIHATGVQYADA